MTQGGPGSASESISVYMYKVGFRSLQWSYIAAAAILVLVLVSVAAVYALKPLQAPGGATPTRHEKEQ
jgi:multiple sugar transport system permease protein